MQALERIIAERTADADSPQMFQMDTVSSKLYTDDSLPNWKCVVQDTTERFGLTIRREEADVASKLTQRNEETGETEEATVAIQGIVCGVNLPPFEIKSR